MEKKNSGIHENKNSKSSGQKILAVVVGIVVAAFAVIMIFAAAGTHGGGSSEKESTAKTFKKADVVGCWQVDPDQMQKGYSEYLVLTNDGKSKGYQLKNNKFDWYNDGKYKFSDNKIKANYTQFLFKSNIKNTETYSYKPTFIVKDAKKNTLKLSAKSGKDRIILKMNRVDESKVKPIEDAAIQKLNDFTAASMPKEHTFGAGKYTCGKDFEPGTYDLIALSGSGNVFCDDEGLNEILGTDSDYASPSYNGETFVDGDVLEIQDNLQLKLSPQE
ncbi:MAG: hypothetical protein ACI39G_00240 [Pseudoramibacter sp.]